MKMLITEMGVERSAAIRNAGTKSPLKIFANISKSFIGAGVLGLPYAFKQAGIVEGLLVMILICIVSVKATLLLIDCKYAILISTAETKDSLLKSFGAEKSDVSKDFPPIKATTKMHENITYGEVGFYAVGYWGKILVDSSLLISQIGFCCVYLIFISENLSSYLPNVDQRVWLLVLLPPLFLLTLFREMKRLAFFSLFAQITNLCAFAVVFWFDFQNLTHPNKKWTHQTYSLQGLPFFFAVAIYCFEGAGMILSLEFSVAKEIRHHFRKYFLLTMLLVTALYITFGSIGYLAFGVDTNAIITFNLPTGFGIDFAMIVKLCLCVSLFFTYPLVMFPVTEMLEKQYSSSSNLDKAPKENFLRLCLVGSTGLIVILIPSFADLMALIGATYCTLLGFILPAYFHLKLYRKSLTYRQIVLDYFLIGIGIVGAIAGTLDTFQRIYQNIEYGSAAQSGQSRLNTALDGNQQNFSSILA